MDKDQAETVAEETAEGSPSTRAKALALRDGSNVERALVPARMVNEVLYCERLMVLEWIQGEWDSNYFTADGTRVHKRVDAGKKSLGVRPARSKPDDSATDDTEEKPYQARSVWLSSERLGVTAKLDVVDVDGGKAMAVEYKRGKRPPIPEGAYLPERAQLCVHVLLLREHGYQCDEGEIYFAADRQRTRIAITDELLDTTLDAIRRARELAASGHTPPPLVNSPKCPHCSLNTICLPDEVNLLRAKRLPLLPGSQESADDDVGDEDPANDGHPANDGTTPKQQRRILPAKTPKVPLYVTTQGAAVRLDGEQLKIYVDSEKRAEARLPNTSHVALFGNAQISTQAIRSLIGRGIGVHFFTYGGWWAGACVGADTNNVELRLAQYKRSLDPEFCLAIARRWVHSKIANCRTMLRRNHRDIDAVTLKELKILARKALQAESQASLLGIEGTAARTYFGGFLGMLSDASIATGYTFEGRNRRPPRDRINALLSFSYSLLVKDLLAACRTAGLDPLLGFYHQPHFGRPSLALDLMEEFRPILADSAVLQAVNNGVVKYDDFQESAGAVALDDKARGRFIRIYEQRLEQEILHPLFSYRLSYRRVLDVQARLLSRVLLGDIDDYPIFRTR